MLQVEIRLSERGYVRVAEEVAKARLACSPVEAEVGAARLVLVG